MTAKEAIAQELEKLSEEQLLHVLSYAKSLQQSSRSSRRRSLHGIWKELGVRISSEDIAKMRKEAKEAKVKAAKAKAFQKTIVSLLGMLAETEKDDSKEDVKIPKTTAKNKWYLTDYDMNDLTPVESKGNRKYYDLSDVIRKSHSKHGTAALVSKLGTDAKRKKEYADRLLGIVNEELDSLPPADASSTIKRIESSLTGTKEKITKGSEEEKLELKKKNDHQIKYVNEQIKRYTEKLKTDEETFKRKLAENDTKTKKKLQAAEKMMDTLNQMFGGRCDDVVEDKENESPKKKQRKA